MSNSPIDDPTPFQAPALTGMTGSRVKSSDFAKLARSRKYKEVEEYIEDRIKYHQFYLPGGLKPEQVKDEDVAQHWKLASMVIAELEMFKGIIEGDLNRERKS